MSDKKTIVLDHQLARLPLTQLEYVLLVHQAVLQDIEPEDWVRELLRLGCRSDLHRRLKDELLGRVNGHLEDEL